MFMRRSCVASLLLVSCFDGGKATGLPCTEDAECGNEQCINNVCGGEATTGGTTPSTSESESLTTSMTTMSDTTTMDTDPSTTMTSTTAGTSTTSDESSSSGETPSCPPPPPDPALCTTGGRITTPTPIALTPISHPSLGATFSVLAGDFFGDDQIDIAVLNNFGATHIIENDEDDAWQVTAIDFNPGGNVQPYDFGFGDLACDGGMVFVYGGQGNQFAYVGYSKADGFFDKYVAFVPVPLGTFSLAIGDLVPDDVGLLDVVLAGNQHVTVLQNAFGFNAGMTQSFEPPNALYAEPWDVQIIGADSDLRILVPAGDQEDTDPTSANQLVYSLLVDPDDQGFTVHEAMPANLSPFFTNPWAMASGDFNDDGNVEIAVAERNVDSPDEGTTVPGTIRFFTIDDTDSLVEIGDGMATDIGPNALAVADMNCDGMMDLVIGTTGAPGVGGAPQVAFGAEDISAMVAVSVEEVSGVSSSSRIAIADFDGDGRPEAAIGDYGLAGTPGDRVILIDVE